MRLIFFNIFLIMAMLATNFACNSNKNDNPNLLIAGTTSKTWKTVKETMPSGDKDKITDEEKKEKIQFFANGTFVMSSPTENANGTWTYDPNAKNLSMQFAGADVTENFSVLNLEDDEMKLKAGDGSEMKLEKE
jgi:hypothetical protein